MQLLTGVEAASLSMAELQKMVKPVFKAARQRADRMMKSEQIKMSYSPALRAAQQSRPRGQVSLFESLRKTRNELLMEYTRAKNFLQDTTSTVKGTIDYMKSINEALKNRTDIAGLNVNDTMKMLEAFDKLTEVNSWVENQRFKYEVFEALSDQISKDPSGSVEDITNRVEGMLEDIYRANVEEDDFYDVF